MVTDGNQTYYGDHFKMYRNIESLRCVTGTNTVLQVNYTSKTNTQIYKPTEKQIRFGVARGRGWGGGELDEGSQKIQTFTYKIRTKDVTYNMINLSNCCALCTKFVKRVNPKNSHNEEKIFYFFNVVSI